LKEEKVNKNRVANLVGAGSASGDPGRRDRSTEGSWLLIRGRKEFRLLTTGWIHVSAGN
jgi:hypothetical protein